MKRSTTDLDRPRYRRYRYALTAFLFVAAQVAVIPPAAAAGSPDVGLVAATPGRVLYGAPVTVSLEATNPDGPDGFNLSFHDVLPVGVSYVPGSASPEPTIISRPNGTTALLWRNVSDLLTGTTVAFSYRYLPSSAVYDVDDTISTAPGAYVHDDPRVIPRVDGNGAPVATSFTGYDTAATTTTLVAFEITKGEPNTEAELLRGVHDHQTAYTIRVDNNLVNPTAAFSIVDHLPAGLEFLGCGTVDNTTTGEEYPLSGPINPGNAPILTNPCPVPSAVTTVTTDPDGSGPMPLGVYTRVEWSSAALAAALGSADLAAGAHFEFDYVAAVPLRRNVEAPLTDPTANLDNNTGPLTYDEQALENYALATGTYDGRPSPSTDDDTMTVSAEDVSIHKSVDTGSFEQGSASVWTLLVESSEYTTSTGPITVTDTVPDGLDVASSTPAPDAGFPAAGPNGSLVVEWTLPGFTTSSADSTITLRTTTRADYRATGGPVSASDGWTNTVALATDATIITAPDGSESVLSIADESSAGQAATAPVIVKEVSEPVVGDLTCGDGGTVTFDPVVAGDYRPGDRVCWRLTVEFPGLLDTLTPVVQDYLPAGFEFEDWEPGSGDDGLAAASPFTDGGALLEWDLGSAIDVGSLRFEAVVQTVITDPLAAADGDILSNLMKFRYTNTDGSVFQRRDMADATWAEPQLTLAKGVVDVNDAAVPGAPADDVVVQNGDVVTYRATVSNSGSVEALAVDVRDTLPEGIDCGDVSNISAGGTCDVANSWIDWPAALGLTVAGGGSLDLNYDITVPTGTSAARTFVNTAGIRTYEGDTNHPTAPRFTYVPASNIDPTLETSANTDAATDTSSVRTGVPGITKTRTTSVSEAGNAALDQATIGETVRYSVTVTLPGGTAYYGPTEILDALSAARLDLDESSLAVTLDGAPLPGGFTVSTAGNTVGIRFPGDASTPYETPAGASQTIVATFDAVVRDDATNARGGSIDNRADLTYRNATGTPTTTGATITTAVVEPDLTLQKSNDDPDGMVGAGQTLTYTVTAGNRVTASVAHDVTVVDTVPADLIVRSSPGVPAVDGATIAPSGGVWDATARTITWSVASIDPGGTAAFSYEAVTADPLVPIGEIVNNAVATTSTLAGADPDERDSTPAAPGYQANASNTVRTEGLSIAKSGTPGAVTVGQTITYTVDVVVPADVIAYDVTVIDDPPPGIEVDGLDSVTCDQAGGPCSPDVSSVDVTTDGDVVSFFVGDLTSPAAEARRITITYLAYVADVPSATAGTTLTNGARVYLNRTDRIAGDPPTPPDPAGFDGRSDPATDAVAVTEPSLTIDKDVAGQVGDTDTRRAKPGDTLTYTVRVTNSSGATRSAAHDLTVSDTVDPRLTNYVFPPVAGVVNSDADPSDGTLGWTIAGPLDPGETVTITYQLTVPGSLDSSDEVLAGAEVLNTADVPSYFGVPAVTRAANPGRDFRAYDDVLSDTVEVELDLASIGDVVWFDVNGDGIVDPGEPRFAGIPVTVTYLGADGSLGGGDDESVTVTTDADGVYLVDRLPGGAYFVDVDESSSLFPAGFVPSYDRDGGLTTANGEWAGPLGEDRDRRDVDFGYAGAGSVGDTIWFDRDGDGVQDVGEAGIAGVDVVVTWFGPDGVRDAAPGGDDVVYPAVTTDAAGAYLVGRVPAGNLSVEVRVATLPTGFAPVWDADGGLDHRSSLTLSSGEDDLDQDFGYRGSGSIGDTIYLDVDGSGDQGPGEPGLSGVTVLLEFAGLDGDFDTDGDDSTFTTTTDASGGYLFDFLPPGEYLVTVTGGLPAAIVNSDDPDGGGDSVAVLALGNGEDDLDQDFGYEASGVLGDRIWWDLDRDGAQDPGEPGLGGVTVTADGPNGLTFSTVTADDGSYLFEDLPDGAWTVTVTGGVPAGMTQTFDANGPLDGTSATTLAGVDLDQDFGYTGNSSIGDRVWLDRDGDGVQDGDEPGIENVTIVLTWAPSGGGAEIELTTTTDDDGFYLFDNLPAGSFSVRVDGTDPDVSTLAPTFDRDGTTVSPDGETRLVLGVADDVTDVDFGYRGGATIGDLVWYDRDGDGTRDADEPGLAGIGVTLLWLGEDDIPGTGDEETFTTVTGSDGEYLFGGLPEGTYDVTVTSADLPPGMLAVSDPDGGLDDTSRVVLTAGGVDRGQDFGYRGAAVVGDTVWLDLDGNGSRDLGEPGVPGQPVIVTWSGPAGPVSFTTVTDADGAYAVDGLPDGAVTVTVSGGISAVATNTVDPDGGGDSTSTITIVGGASDLAQDFGYRGPNTVGDLVWYDIDTDGTQDVGEPGLAGVDITVTWFGPDGALGGGDDIEFLTATDGAGGYSVAGLPDGTVSMSVGGGLPPGLATFTYDEDDATDEPDGSTVVDELGVADAAPVNHLTADVGVAGSGAIGDIVWLDLDGNGVPDAGEPGIPDVLVTLTWAGPDGDLGTADDVVLPTQRTDEDGSYRFEALPDGPFRIDLSGLPAGVAATADPDGGPADTATVRLDAGNADLDQDFGYRGDASIGDTIWTDLNGNGVQDPGEAGLAGITVTVTSPGADGTIGTADDIVVTTATDGDGRYLVEGLPGVTTRVSFDPSDLGPGLVPASDRDGGVPTTTTVDLGPGDAVRDADFAVRGDAAVYGIIFDDRDRDGVQDADEPGIAGVAVTLLGADGTPIATVSTDPSGAYRFEQLPPGTYSLVLDPATLPADFTQTGDPDATNDLRTTVELSAGDDGPSRDFGFAASPENAAAGDNRGGPGALAFTGSTVARIVVLALMSLLAGRLLGARSRRRRAGR